MAESGDKRPQTREAKMIVRLFKVDRTRNFRMHGGAAQFFGGHFLTDRACTNAGPARNNPLPSRHQHVIGHNRKIRASGNTHIP